MCRSSCSRTFICTWRAPHLFLAPLLHTSPPFKVEHMIGGNSFVIVLHFITCTYIMLNEGYWDHPTTDEKKVSFF